MSRKVYLHVGAPKTGTTYLQDRLTVNAASLAEHGVHFPTRSPLMSPGLFHFRAALDLLGQDWGGAPGHATGSWDVLVRRIRRTQGTVVVSHEILAPARAEYVARAMRDLADSEVHVVYSARDLGRQLPAAWQESIKQGRNWSYRKFLRRARTGRLWFFRAFDIPAVLGTWGNNLPPARIHVVTVPHSRPAEPLDQADGDGSDADSPLWLRFCEVFGIDPAWAPRDSTRANRSLGIAETQVLRQLNLRLGRATRREAAYDELIRELLAQDVLVNRRSAPVRLPAEAFDWVEERTERWIEWIEQSGVDVVGDVADLWPVRPPEDERWHDPDRVSARKRVRAAMDALTAMTREAAARPDPGRALAQRIRGNVDRLRLR